VNTEAAVISAVCQNKDIAILLADDVDEIFISHRDVWDGLKNYYYKFKAVPDVSILTDRFKDFDPVPANGETAYYLDKLKDEFLSAQIRNTLLKAGNSLKTDAAARVLGDLQSSMSKLTRYTNSIRDVDITDYEAAERHIEVIRNRAAEMGGSPGIPTGFKAMDLAYPTGMAPGHLIVVIGWPGRG